MGTVLGSPSIEVSEVVSEQIRAWRFKREIRHIQKAKKQLEDAGMDPKKVPMRTLAPLMEGATLEEDDDMGEHWASLLANAAGGQMEVPPSFPNVLRELQPREASILNTTYDILMRIAPELRWTHGVQRPALVRAAGCTEEEFDVYADNLIRLRLLDSGSLFEPGPVKTLQLTPFGRAFVRACLPPGQTDPPVMIKTLEELEAARQATSAEASGEG